MGEATTGEASRITGPESLRNRVVEDRRTLIGTP
jgi:hypothetical protein